LKKYLTMKKILLSAIALLTINELFAQLKEGTIIYERKINMHRQITDEQMKAMIPEFRTSKHQLLFSDSTSIYKAVPEDNAPDPFAAGGGGGMVIRMGGSDNAEQYRNYSQAKAIDSRELGAKTYLIEDTIKAQGWKLTDETATLLNYPAKKATRQNERGQSIDVWYTESIPTPVGPEGFAGLPGAILKVDINNGQTVFNAISVSDKVNKSDIKEPKKGKKIGRQEFMKLMQETMGNPGPGGGNRVIRIG
jgi:GLPGLI family protein